MINQIELARGELISLRQVLDGLGGAADLKAAADSMEAQLIAVEEDLYQLRQTGRGQDGIRWPARLIQQLGYLFGGLGGTDYRPTTQHGEVARLLREQTRASRQRLDAFLQRDLERFNQRLRERGLQGIVVRLAPAT